MKTVFREGVTGGENGMAAAERPASMASVGHFRGYSVPELIGMRGAGLGNEIVAWAKAFIAAQELGLRCLAPPWALNPRGYRADFATGRLDWAFHWALRMTLPTVRVTNEMVRSTGEWDYALAIRALRPRLAVPRLRPVVLLHEPLSGGYVGIARAGPFLMRELMRPAHVVRDLYAIDNALDRRKLTVAVHIRAGDFVAADQGPGPGEFSKRIPASWYEAVIAGFERHFRGRVTYLLFTDDPSHDVARALMRVASAVLPPERKRPLLSDILAMAGADALVCSVSAFSMLAAFLSEAPYVWYAPNLTDHGGWLSLWGHEATQRDRGGLTARNLDLARATAAVGFGRGSALGHDGTLSDRLLDVLEQKLVKKDKGRDLLHYGVVRSLQEANR